MNFIFYKKIQNIMSFFLCGSLFLSQTTYALSPKTFTPSLINQIDRAEQSKNVPITNINDEFEPNSLQENFDYHVNIVRKKILDLVDKKSMSDLEDIILSEWKKNKTERDWVLLIEAVSGLNLLGKSKNKFIRQNFQYVPQNKLKESDYILIRKEFLFWFARNPENRGKKRDYSTYEKTYNAVIAIPKKYRNIKFLSKLYENGGDKELLEACKEFKIVVEYPDKESAILELLKRPIQNRTAKVLKLSLEKGGNQRLLEAVRNYEIPLPNDKLVNRPYQDAEDTLEAILELPNELRSKSKLKKYNYALYRAYHDNFEDEIREKFKYEVPVEKGPKYPDVEETLLGILKRDPLKRNISSMLEDGEEALVKSYYEFKDELKEKFNYILPRWTKYSTIEEVLNDLLDLPLHLRTPKMLKRNEINGGNRALLEAARDFNIKLPSEYVGEYKTGDDVLISLLKLPEYKRTAILLNKKKEDGGDPGLLSAYYVKFYQNKSENYGFELTKGTKEKYQTYDEAYYALRSRPKEHQSYSALKGSSKYGLSISDSGLLNACKRFGIPLYNDITKKIGDKSYRYLESLYPTPTAVYEAIMALPEEQRTRGFLRKTEKEGGNKALYKQYINFEYEIRRQFNYILPKYLGEPMYRYHRDIALLGLLELSPEQRTATQLEKISKSLLRACRKFNIPLLEEQRGIYNSAEDVLKAILKKPKYQRNISFLQQKRIDDGDPNLVKAYYDYREEIERDFNYSIPNKVFAEFPDTESLLIALLSIPKEERNHWHLDRKDEDGGNRLVLSAYYANSKKLFEEFNFVMENPGNLHYPTKMSVLKEYFKRSKDERSIDALDRPDYENGNRRLLRAAKFHGIELERTSKRMYNDAETTLIAILTIPKEERKLSLFSVTLRNAYYEFKDEIKEKFNYEVPYVDTSKYPKKEDAENALNEIPLEQQTINDLKKMGYFALVSACKKFDIPLRKKERVKKIKKVSKEQKDELTYYEKFRKQIITEFDSGRKVDVPLALWKKINGGDSFEAKEAKEILFAYFIYFALQQAEKVVLKNRSYDQIKVSQNAASMLSDLVGSAGEAILNAIDTWQPNEDYEGDTNTSFETHVLSEISSAIKLESKNIFADYWRTVSISKPSGNKGGDNTISGNGQFASTSKRTIEDRLVDESLERPDEAVERFEKMMQVVDGIQTGNYGFFEEAGFDFDESLVFSHEQKMAFIDDFKQYLDSNKILKNIQGSFGLWIMGSMGRIGLARKGLSDVNLLLITDQPQDMVQEMIVELKRAIGSGVIEKGNSDNYILTIGKHDSYMDMLLHSKNLLNLIEKHNLGDLENGIASIEIVSLETLSQSDNRALNRAHFHVSENIYEMGANGHLIIESESDFSKRVNELFKKRVNEGNLDYLFFMNNYLSNFLKKQVLKVINAHKFAKPINDNKGKQLKDLSENNEEDSEFEYVDYFLDNTLRAGIINGTVSLAFTSLFNEGISIDKSILAEIVKKYKGKKIIIDDPLIDEEKYPNEFAKADEQTNVIYEMIHDIATDTDIYDDANYKENQEGDESESTELDVSVINDFFTFYHALEGVNNPLSAGINNRVKTYIEASS